ncbi:MAG: hypothetical protein A3F80_05515 [Candidatus Melainabacteria bacterium RIFCSPLOWO2_12_FULL_35_11]|nr:MAG: hypothetical protein A3F80_05515 [Candidatus Melainabacteria bacterium RIFCSPLOWO2_12_FULL_35_11]
MKIKNIVSINLILAMLVLTGLCLSAKAESIQKIFLNDNISVSNNIRFEKVSTLQCATHECFKRPNDAAISNDGSFVLVADSSNPGSSGINLKKFNFAADRFTDVLTLPLIQKSTNSPLLNLALNQNSTRALVYREPTEGENTLVQLIDLSTNTLKELSSVSSSSTKIGVPAFLDAEGKKLIAGTLDLSSPQLVVVDLDTDSISNKISLSDKIQSVIPSPNFKQAVITYSADLGQSVSIYNIPNNSLSTLNIDDEELAFSVDDFLGKVNFDLSGNRAVVASFGGNHVLHFLDLKSNKLTPLILDKTQYGPTISTISPDGKTTISIGSILKKSVGFKIYKSSILADGSVSFINSVSFLDGSIALDVDISPDQNKIYVLELKNNSKQLKILDLATLKQIAELIVSSDNTQSFLAIDPNGRYAITPNTKTEASVSIITDLTPAPILKSIIPNGGSANGGSAFTINGFVDLTKFTTDLKVCFKSSASCATSTTVSKNGQVITGITPKVSQSGLSDVTLIAKSITDGSLVSSKYEDIFQFVKDASTISDTFPPEITVLAPKDSTAYNTKRIRVLGKADGTGSQIDSVLINGIPATLSSEGVTNPSSVNFSSDIQADKDGPLQITVIAKDKADNTTEKSVKITVDTILPAVTANIQPGGTGQLSVSGTAKGTGTSVSSISVNSVPVSFTESENVNFNTTVNSTPVTIIVSDKAGNKTQVQISSTSSTDSTPPTITLVNPSGGSVFKDNPITTVTFSVTDDSLINTVKLNGKNLSVSADSQYSENLTLSPGENSISIVATDTAGNKSVSNITVSFIPSITGTMSTSFDTPDFQKAKEVITIDPSKDLNDAIKDQLVDESGNVIDIGNTSSVEISNPPPIPDGEPAQIELPVVEGLHIDAPSSQSIPKGFSFATGVSFINKGGSAVTISDVNADKLFTSVLVDATGKTFVVGFASLKPVKNTGTRNKLSRFQTANGILLDLITTLTIPSDANEGSAKVSVIDKNDSLATVLLNIAPPKKVTIGKRIIPRPQIKEPINAIVKNQGKKLILIIKGKNFIGRIATIDGKLQKLLGKGKFFTNVTFVPSEGITINNFQVQNNKLILTAAIDGNVESGIKLFNIITPKGADIGGIVFPAELQDGKLQTTASPESLLLQNSQ